MQAHNDGGPLCCDADNMEKAQNGDSFAQLDLGNAYYAAYQMENNCSLAFKWISLSAQQGNMEAQFRLGDLYALGQGTKKCHTRAYEWYTNSALQGYSKALTRIHNLYEDDKYMHCKGYQNEDEISKWSQYYLFQTVEARELSEYRLQQTALIQNHAMEFYQQRFNTLIRQKEVKNTGAQLQLGFMYQHGYGTKRSIIRAIECYSTAAKEGVSEAEYNLGDIFLNKKEGTKHDNQEASKWFSKAAENGNVMAQCSLAHLYEKGIGVGKDYSKALHWYSLAAEMGYTPAQLSIARIHRTGQGVLQDYNKAIEWYNRAAKGGNRAAQNCLDQLHAQDERNPGGNNTYYKNPINGRRMNSLLRQHISGIKDLDKVKQLKKLVLNIMRRDINAMYDIGIKYRDGVDLPQDNDLSVKWIKKSARGGLEKARLAIGEIYEQGKLVEQDYHRASIWYKKKPRRKNDTFQYRLGMLYYYGSGVRRDYLEASKWFIKSAEKNNNKSQCQLGWMRELGDGVRRDTHDAFEWYKKAAHQRNGKAMHALGKIYLNGDITEKDSSRAILWFRHAFNHGGEAAAFDLINLYKDYKNELNDLKTSNIFLEDPSNTHYECDIYSSIATCYLKGYIVEQDYCNAYKFIKKSFALGFRGGKEWLSTPARLEDQLLKRDIDGNDLVAMFLLVSEKGIDNLKYNAGYAYEFGLRGDYSHMTPVKANISKAVECYMIASKKGDTRADYRLGIIYEEGKCIERNISVAIGFYSKAIEQEDPNAMYRLANMYLRGKGMAQNFEKAYQLFTDAHNKGQCYSHLFLKNSGDFLSTKLDTDGIFVELSTEEDDQNELLYYSNEKESNILSFNMIEAVGHSGNIAVQYQLGCLYGDTESDDRDYPKAAYWFGLASQGGITDAYYRLGRLYEEGQGVENNYLQSFILYRKAADKHHDKALYRLAQMYQCGLGTPIDFNKAFTFYKKSAEQGNEMGKLVVTFLKGSLHDSSQTTSEETSDLSISEMDDIISMYEYVANAGNTDIQFELGCYFESKQLEPDYTRATEWYSMAKDLGHIDATYCLGRLYELGLGITQDYGYAFELYTIAKKGGLSEATFRLGNMYQSGFGVKVDYQQAFDYYTEASEQGNLDAQFKLGQMYAQGIFKSTNTLEALKWFTRSYLQGNNTVRESLYLLYDGDEPYERVFYCRMAKMLQSYAKNEDYHMDEGFGSSSEIYARLFHAYLNGQGVQKNSEFAWHYLCIVVKLNTRSPGLIFGESAFHFIKDNVSEIYNMALTQLENGDESACVILGTLYLGGVILLEETKEGGKKIYSSVFEDIFDLSDNSLYDENLAIGTVIVPKDYKKALQYFSKASNAGDSYSKLIVGVMYHCGYGAKQNFTKASEYYQQLLNPGPFTHIARKYLGYLYAFGEGVDRDNDLVLKYSVMEEFSRGHFFNIAQILYYGNEETRNHKTALKFLLTAENARSFNGLHLIKKVNEHDLNVQSNLVNGVYCLVSRGVVDGEVQYMLGIMYEKGQGTRVNCKEAIDRFSKAAKCGNKMAENHLKLYYKDGKFINKNS